MNKALIAVVGFLIVVGLGILGLSSMYTGAHDKAVDFESNIETLYKASENDLSAYTMKIQEKTQIADMYVSDLRSVIGEYFNGKQGVSEKNVMSFLQQHIPNLDSKIYQELMITIEAGRESFSNTQKLKLDQCGAYNKFRKGFWNSKILDSGTFPGKDVEHWCTVVSDAKSRNAMQTGIQEPLKLK